MGTDTHTGSTSLKNGDGHSHRVNQSEEWGWTLMQLHRVKESEEWGRTLTQLHRVNQSEEQGTFEAALATEHRISGWNHIKFGISGKHSGN